MGYRLGISGFNIWAETITLAEYPANYINKNRYIRYWDDDAKAPFLWNEAERIFYAFDDDESLRHKADYIKQHGLTGAMYREHSHDVSETLPGVLYKELIGNH